MFRPTHAVARIVGTHWPGCSGSRYLVALPDKNFAALADLSGQWIDLVHGRRPPRSIVLDMDSNQNSWTAHGVGACRILVVTRSRQGGDVDPKRAKAQLRCLWYDYNPKSASVWAHDRAAPTNITLVTRGWPNML